MTLPHPLNRLAPYRKTAWKPITEMIEAHSAPQADSLSSCPECQNPMDLFLHLNSNDLPQEFSKDNPSHFPSHFSGTLQVFYCTHCDDWEPFSKSNFVKLIENDNQPSQIGNNAIVGWEAMDDYPNSEELSDLGCELTDAEEDELHELDYPQTGDKLGGYPFWVQGVEYPHCPECGEAMQLVFQLDSEDNIDYMFGDSGCAHVTQCKNHPHQLALGWACY